MKIMECKVVIKGKPDVVLTVKNDGHHYRAFDSEGLQKCNPWIQLPSLLDELGAELMEEGEEGKGEGGGPAGPVGGGQGKAANTEAKCAKAFPETEKMRAALKAAGESFEDNMEEFKNTYQDYPEDARAMAEGVGCNYEALVKEVETAGFADAEADHGNTEPC